ncbi:MAG: LysE family translocator [Methylocystis sp.]|jgi:threonine/homoserine/homoserine lactone efflux protein|nr:LysE family translocator [Methylocystis sp.]MCA3583109.1 LysE family translocator [Methylocystis sp.]MCA3588386.1 LysE family translocator [Methylocystis sp.]MCA3593258.1 LysE family translocator [Methylocystis sp.]
MDFTSFVPPASVMAAYSLACFILFATPGPDMSLFLSRTMAGGREAGIASMLGASLGTLIHTVLAAVGLSALIAASPTAFLVIKIVGALYLAWLALDAIRNGSALNVRNEGAREISFMRVFWLGVMVNLSNPKVVLFFVTFLPQFVSAADPFAARKLAFLGLYFIVFSIPLGILMILGAERVVTGLKRRPQIMRIIDYLFAGIFGAFAVKILLTEGR